MNPTEEGIKILVALLPGFLFFKVLGIKSSLKKLEAHEYIVDALIVSLAIYALALLIGIDMSVVSWELIGIILGLTIILALVWSWILNNDWLAKLLSSGDTYLSAHASIFPINALDKFRGKWHLIRYKDGKEIVGIVRKYNHETHEALIENGRIVKRSGELSKDSAWYYVPAGDQIIYMRTLERS